MPYAQFSSSRLLVPLLLAGLSIAPLGAQARRAPRDPWAATVERVNDAVMSIQLTVTRSLDTEGASSSEGTGFVVDRERGLVLTNRHMVHVGPVRARGILRDNEEIELFPVYRDPIHDFGFYRFDPAKVQYMELQELDLAPERARVGLDIRVMGNDAGEKLSILDGTLARLDRPAPFYGSGSYNDFNTYYYQAATSTSGGSSGSPVVDVTGAVVALNAGGSRGAASSFYLPVGRVERVLEHLRRGEPVPRGSLQAVYQQEPFDELRRLGLDPATERTVRAERSHATGMLVVREIVPGGPADGLLLPGDILLSIAGVAAASFDLVEDVLDSHVGEPVDILVDRGGLKVGVSVGVDDLHALTPTSYIEFSQAILQETSLQMAHNDNVPAQGVVLIEPGYAFRRARIPGDALIESIDGQPVPDLDAMERVLSSLHDGQRVRVAYHDLGNPRQPELEVLTVDHGWSPGQRCFRNDASGFWDCRPLDIAAAPPAAAEPEPARVATFEQMRDPVAAVLAPSFCHVRFTIPYRTEGVEGWTYIGAGVVLDAERGLVYTDRGTVPIGLGDVELTFAGSVRVPAEVVFLHPRHNIAILRYDPAQLGGLPVKAATIAREVSLDAGDAVYQVGLTSSMRVVSQATTISRVDAVSGSLPSPPAFVESNTEVYKLAEQASSIGGVLADERGAVVGLWTFNLGDDGSSFLGLPVDLLFDLLDPLRHGEEVRLRDLGVEVEPMNLAAAADRGAPADWIDRLAQADPERRQALEVQSVHPDAPAFGLLEGGDVLLAVGGEPVTRPRRIEQVVQQSGETVMVTLLRDGAVAEIEVGVATLDNLGVGRVLSFAGALLHEPHRAVGLAYGEPIGGLYVSWYWYGGPAAHYGLRASTLVRGINGQPVATMDDFIAAVRDLPDGAPVRLDVESLGHVKDVATLLTDTVYWPTMLIEHTPEGWVTRRIGPAVAGGGAAD
ncbi:MAG: trypsin-like peptidase domain-containing protein [Pseudomonadota bacterium]